jgi:hypothetical protein
MFDYWRCSRHRISQGSSTYSAATAHQSFALTSSDTITSAMQRRTFLYFGIVTWSWTASSACALSGETSLRSLAHSELQDMVGPDVIRSIGQQYRIQVPHEDDIRILQHLLKVDSSQWRLTRMNYPMAEASREEFASGRVLVVDGWVIARSEARQCALFSLLSPS